MALKGIILDVYDTTLVTQKRVADPYRTVMNVAWDLGVAHDPKLERYELLTQKKGLDNYLYEMMCRAPDGFPFDAYHATAILMHSQMKAHKEAYQPRAEWPEFVAQSKDYDVKLCLGSNLAASFVPDVREKLGAADHMLFSCEAGHAKPQVEFFHACCEMLGTRPDETVMIGNSLRSDIAGAQKAGCKDAFWLPEPGTMVNADQFEKLHGIRDLRDVFQPRFGLLG